MHASVVGEIARRHGVHSKPDTEPRVVWLYVPRDSRFQRQTALRVLLYRQVPCIPRMPCGVCRTTCNVQRRTRLRNLAKKPRWFSRTDHCRAPDVVR